MRILHEDCDPKLADDKKLPYTAYLICYKKDDGAFHHDISISGTQVELFDHYYDKYKTGFQWMKQAEGRVAPALWKSREATPPKKKKKQPRE